MLYIRHFLHSLHLSPSLLPSSLPSSQPPARPPARQGRWDGRPLVIRNMPIKVIWTLRLFRSLAPSLPPSLSTADDNQREEGKERSHPTRSALAAAPSFARVASLSNLKCALPARCRAQSPPPPPHVSFVSGGGVGVGKGAYYELICLSLFPNGVSLSLSLSLQ